MKLSPLRTAAVLVAATALLTVGAVADRWWSRTQASHSAAPPATARKVMYWYDPMLPDQHFPKPGLSSMGMQMVPRYGEPSGATGIRIEPGTRQNLGIRTERVVLGALANSIHVPGIVGWNLGAESTVSMPVQAIVSSLPAHTPFQRVRAGQPVAVVLAPEWSAAVAEARALANSRTPEARALARASSQRLHVLGLSGSTATSAGIVLRAPRSGVVTEVLVREGQALGAGMTLLRINGTDTMWVDADLPQTLTSVVAGTQATLTFPALPARTFSARVDTVLPQVDTASRARRARIVLDNRDGELAPGMFADVALQPAGDGIHPLVPTDALISTGDDTRVVLLRDDGRMESVQVATGRSAGGRTEILRGLAGGERVVTSGQFLIDSEASLSGGIRRLGEPDATSPAVVPAAPIPSPLPSPSP